MVSFTRFWMVSMQLNFLYRRLHGNTLDYRTRRNRTQRRTDGFARQISAIADAYMRWMFEMGDDALTKSYVPPPQATVQGSYKIKVLDMFSESIFWVQCSHTDYSRELYNDNRTYSRGCLHHDCPHSPRIGALCLLFTDCCFHNPSA